MPSRQIHTEGRHKQDLLISDVNITEVHESTSDCSAFDVIFGMPLFFSAGVISNWTDESRIPPCTIYQAFKYFLDITTPPSPVLLQQFAPLATNEKQRKRLEVLSKVGKTSAEKKSID